MYKVDNHYRDVVLENDNYTVELEYYSGLLFLHCDVRNISKTVFSQMVGDWLDIEEALMNEGFDKVYAVPEKDGFVKYTGWELLTTVDLLGEERGVWVWELQPESKS